MEAPLAPPLMEGMRFRIPAVFLPSKPPLVFGLEAQELAT